MHHEHNQGQAFLAKSLKRQERRHLWLTIGACLLALLLCAGGYILKSSFEAAAYARVTGRPVTTWDAMWLALRVGCP